MSPPVPAHAPVLTLDEARTFEATLFAGDEAKEWSAMRRAGAAVAAAVLRDYREIGPWPAAARVLVLAGKGHNGGDALLAARAILDRHRGARAEVVLIFGVSALKPLALRAYQELLHAARDRVETKSTRSALVADVWLSPTGPFDVCLDGVFGFQFRPPVDGRVAALLARVNASPVRLRAAVDLPSGLGGPDAFRADFTYATGSVKSPVLAKENEESAGRLRFLDLGFFPAENGGAGGGGSRSPFESPVSRPPWKSALQEIQHGGVPDHVLTAGALDPLRALRAPVSDKRSFGHLFVFGGSHGFPGAVLMSVLAALRAGTGLVTAFVPASLAAGYAAVAPEAIWVGWPETPNGGLALEGLHLFRERVSRATALLIGPGLGREPETLALVAELLKTPDLPAVLDADALQPELVRLGGAPRIVTPHAGEFSRIAADRTLVEFATQTGAVTVLKGPRTQVSDGRARYHSFFGGPVLARGGSGDLLAGMIGGILAGETKSPLAAACRGVVWHGLAAEALARAHGQAAVRTTQVLDFLAPALREEEP